MTERKRRSEDGRDMEPQPPPSLAKKRHTTKEGELQMLSTDFDENATMLDLVKYLLLTNIESIREFQKEAIWRQMQEYKRDAQRAQRHSSAMEQRQTLWEERIAGVCVLWERAVHDLDAILNVKDTNPVASAAASMPQEAWLELMLPQVPPLNDRAGLTTGSDIPSVDEAQSSIERFNKSVNSVLQQLQDTSSQSEIDWAAAIDRLSRSRAVQEDTDELKSRVALFSRQLAESKELLEQRENELRRALKHLDRSICPTVRMSEGDSGAANTNNENGASTSSPPKTGESADGHHQGMSPATNAQAATTNGTAASNLLTQQDTVDYKRLAESRLEEVVEKVHQNTELQYQVDSLKLQIASVPDYIISETALYKQVEASRSYYSAQAQRLQAEVERLFAEVGELKTSRTDFEDGILAETAAQRQALEAEMQRLHGDLVRVRHHRDQVQRELEERRAQDAVEDQKSAELKLLSDVRRERLNALISENKRLLACIAVLKGDRTAFETYTDEELSKTTAVADELRAKLEQVVRREKQLSEQLEALSVQGDGGDEARVTSPTQQPTGDTESAKLMADLQSAREEVGRLQLRICRYEEILGGSVVNDHGSIVEQGSAKSSELTIKQKRIDDLTLERDGLVKTSEMMEREMQTICESFAKLEDQNSSKVWDLSSKEQAIARVIAEKSKYEEKFIGLNKDREAQRLANQTLRNQNAKQLEHIKAIEERDRALAQQLSLMGTEAQQATQAWQATQTKLEEAQQHSQGLEETMKALEEKVRMITGVLNQRTETLGKTEHEKRRAMELLDVADQRIRVAEKVTDPSGLAKLCADYKALLKCSTCQTHFKSHVLLRCMHVFCKQCIDSRIETRQRKCPSCSEPFGAKDVRQIYL
ncbi:E3 ubiquitin-protein ligase bre1 [Coemansia sp. RSA 988]|nr:E3 ubiquitin-protein ligase bre1 [Coemansia sp. RSA 988]